MVAHRVGVLVCLAGLRGLLDGITPFVTRDLYLFSDAGEALVTGRFSDVFSSDLVQVGPLQLALFGINDLMAGLLGYRLDYGVAIAVSIILVVLFLHVFRRACRELGRCPLPGFELFLGLVLLLGGYTYEAATSGHPADGFIPLIWILVAIESRNDRTYHAGALLGLGASLKLLALLGLPLLLLAPSARRALLGTVPLVAVLALSYLPFIRLGFLDTLRFEWQVTPQSPLTFFVDPLTRFDWKMRAIQGSVVIGLGGAMAVLRKGSAHCVWLVPLAITALRYLTDPLDYHYYWLGAGLIGLVGAGASMTSRPSWARAPVAAGFSITLLPFYFSNGTSRAAYIAAISLCMLIFTVFRDRARIDRAHTPS